MKPTTERQHQQNIDAKSRLDFYKDEVRIMQERLDEVCSKNTKKEILPEIEHFQNQITIQAKNLGDLDKEIHDEEARIQANSFRNQSKTARILETAHHANIERVTSFENNFSELRKEYNRFLARRL